MTIPSQPKRKTSSIEKTVPPDAVQQRVDRFLAASDLEFSRSKILRLIRQGDIRINNEVVGKGGHHVLPGDVISIVISDYESIEAIPESIELNIVFEDDHLLVVNKPAGMVVHPAGGNRRGTLVNALLHHTAELSEYGGSQRPGIVHRLDKDTSGLLVVAKTDKVHAALSKQLSDRKMARRYVTLVWGHPSKAAGTIETPIGRHPRHRQRMAVVGPERGRNAITHYQVDQSFLICTKLSVKLETGRTHQIRVHMDYLGHAVVGDETYGGGRKRLMRLSPAQRTTAHSALNMLSRQALHAAELGFHHPSTDQWLAFSAPVPDDIRAAIEIMESMK